MATKQSPGLVTAHGSFEAFCPSRSESRDHASRVCRRGGSAKLGEELLVSLSLGDGFISRGNCPLDLVAASLFDRPHPLPPSSAPLIWARTSAAESGRTAPTPIRSSDSECACLERCCECVPSAAPEQLSGSKLSAFVQHPDPHPGRPECYAALSAFPPNTAPGLSAVAIARQPLGPSFGWLWK